MTETRLDDRATPRRATAVVPRSRAGSGAVRCRRKFLRCFPGGFYDETYLDWERDYKANAHGRWTETLDRNTYRSLLKAEKFSEIASRAVSIESRTNLLFSFEKMALRDAVKPAPGARAFAEGLYEFLHGGRGDLQRKFDRWCEVVADLPRRQTRVLTWPIVTVFGFIALPETHIFLKPNVTSRTMGSPPSMRRPPSVGRKWPPAHHNTPGSDRTDPTSHSSNSSETTTQKKS